jgi:parallel beta-helix repeat protein
MLALAFDIQPVKASGTIYIRADGSVDPPTAPICTVDNVTYVLIGNITSDADGIVIERNNTIVDGAGCKLQGPGYWGPRGVGLDEISNVTIKNMKITAFGDGISLGYASNNTFYGNDITNNMLGIRLSPSEYNNITGNNIAENTVTSIELYNSHNNTILGNNITNNEDGMHLYFSNNNSVLANTFLNDGLSIYDSHGNVAEDNIVNGNPLVYLEEVIDRKVEDAGQVILVNCDGIVVENLTLSNTDRCVELWNTNNTKIADNIMTNNSYGIVLYWSSNNNLSGNCIKANSERGIQCYEGSNNTIVGNNVTQNRYGIYISELGNNIIAGNNISDNGYAGIALPYCLNNSIYHNNFVNNVRQVYTDNLLANIWDDGASGGNYWSDYNGTDANHDGIGDTAYVIDADNADNYPLMVPTVIPEFPSFPILALFMMATLLAVMVYTRRKISDAM